MCLIELDDDVLGHMVFLFVLEKDRGSYGRLAHTCTVMHAYMCTEHRFSAYCGRVVPNALKPTTRSWQVHLYRGWFMNHGDRVRMDSQLFEAVDAADVIQVKSLLLRGASASWRDQWLAHRARSDRSFRSMNFSDRALLIAVQMDTPDNSLFVGEPMHRRTDELSKLIFRPLMELAILGMKSTDQSDLQMDDSVRTCDKAMDRERSLQIVRVLLASEQHSPCESQTAVERHACKVDLPPGVWRELRQTGGLQLSRPQWLKILSSYADQIPWVRCLFSEAVPPEGVSISILAWLRLFEIQSAFNLMVAFRTSVELTLELLDAGAVIPYPSEYFRWAILRVAMEDGSVQTLQRLFERPEYAALPLIEERAVLTAIDFDRLDVARALLHVDHPRSTWVAALMATCGSSTICDPTFVHWMLETGRFTLGETIQAICAVSPAWVSPVRSSDVIINLVRYASCLQGGGPAFESLPHDETLEVALCMSSERGNLGIVRVLLDSGLTTLEYLEPALVCASNSHSVEVTQVLNEARVKRLNQLLVSARTKLKF